ncbi:MAG TPA: Flp pilus assembly protein CpaB [Xanthobacteraceae bacterium]|nr:Flp pilus assembly protein CpaB [Xanthobacteraceae bacterium]
MRTSTIVMIGFAVVFGLLAVFVANSWLNRQAELRLKNMETKPQTVATRTVVVASAPLRFGAPVTQQVLREVSWPEAAIPAGTFPSIADLLSSGKRIVLAAIEPNEPILRSKVTGPGQRATLSAVIQPGMKAVTVRVNDVEGVGGFVLPGDHVDVLMTHRPDKGNGNNDVVLQNTKVLAVDQLADDSADKPAVVKAVTLEVDTVAAQKLSLAASLGSLSLVLRKAGEAEVEGTRRVTQSDLANPEARGGDAKRYSTVVVTRGSQKQEYSVAAESNDWREGSGGARR